MPECGVVGLPSSATEPRTAVVPDDARTALRRYRAYDGIVSRHDALEVNVYLVCASTIASIESTTSFTMRLAPLTVLTALLTPIMASNTTDPKPPTMTLLYRMEAKLGERFSLGPVPNGQERIVIPIVGGSFEGPRLSGTYYATQTYISCSNAKH